MNTVIRDGIWHWREFMIPQVNDQFIVRVEQGAGDTPLLRAHRLEEFFQQRFGVRIVIYLLLEGKNPTGSFKDRGMEFAIACALQDGFRSFAVASTGNTSASVVAHAAKAGAKDCIVIVPEDIAEGKMTQLYPFGPTIRVVSGSFDDAYGHHLKELVSKNPELKIMNSSNPDRLEGQKTAAYEIVSKLKQAPDYHFLPVGNAGNITAYWRGYKECYKNGPIALSLPKMIGAQAEGAAPLVYGGIIEHPKTVASAIKIGNPVHRDNALRAARESGGGIFAVNDSRILGAQKFLVDQETVWVEPASAAPIALLLKTAKKRLISFKEDDMVVCTLTGAGWKDPDAAEKMRRGH